jgi:hypothetical protein
MPITLKFSNGNEVDIYPKTYTGRFTMDLNSKSKRTRQTADDVAMLLERVRKITCVISSWDAIDQYPR